MDTNNNISQLIEKFKSIGFEIKYSDDQQVYFIEIGKEKINILEKVDNDYIFHLIEINDNKEVDDQVGFKKIIFEDSFNINEILYFNTNRNEYSLSFGWQFRRINNITDGIDELIIKDKYKQKRINTNFHCLTISPIKYKKIIEDIWKVEKRVKGYKGSFKNYLLNELTEKFSSKRIGDTTSINPGEFDFLIHRLNLKTKNNQKDYLKYLNLRDIRLLENLFTGMIKNRVFSETYLKKINNFFRKENLGEIIAIGRDILEIGTTDLNTAKCKSVIDKITNKKIKKLEGLWQEYFKNYLLFLIFSYQSIHSKIGLKNIDDNKKYPDFIGINHYNGLDVIEIKTHLKPAITYDQSHENFSFSSELSKAIIQTTNYMDQIAAEGFKKNSDKSLIVKDFVHEENLHRPRGIIIISSYKHLARGLNEKNRMIAMRDFTKLRNSLHNIQILTFDEIINTADEYLKNVA